MSHSFLGRGTVRFPFGVLGSVTTSFPSIVWKLLFTIRVAASRSMSSRVRASSSPMRRPVQNRTEKPTLAGNFGTHSINWLNCSSVQKCISWAFFFPMEPATLAGFSRRP